MLKSITQRYKEAKAQSFLKIKIEPLRRMRVLVHERSQHGDWRTRARAVARGEKQKVALV